jgi:hypothetical protein
MFNAILATNIYKQNKQIHVILTILISKTQTDLNLTDKSLSETGRARSQF